jgi:hypothetical protein
MSQENLIYDKIIQSIDNNEEKNSGIFWNICRMQ